MQAHTKRFSKGVAYHVVIDRRGAPHYFRHLGAIPAANGAGNNSGTYAVCMLGWNGSGADRPSWRWTAAQKTAGARLIRAIGTLDPHVKLVGHRDLKNTLCPGLEIRSYYSALLNEGVVQ